MSIPNQTYSRLLRRYRKMRRRLVSIFTDAQRGQAILARAAKLGRRFLKLASALGLSIKPSVYLSLATGSIFFFSAGVFAADVPPTILSVSPTSNTHSAANNSNIQISFSTQMSLSSLSAANIIIRGAYSGLLSTKGTFSGNPLRSFDPDRNFNAGELISVSVTGASLPGGTAMTEALVHQFRAGVTSGTALFKSSAFGSTVSQDGALGDLDGDGDLDVLIAARDAANEVWLNNGDASFASSTFGWTDGNSHGVAIGDLDNDGDLDAIFANRSQANEVWLGNGDGTFTSSLYGTGNSADVALGDLDGDGDLDAVIANLNAKQAIWLNNGDGSFTSSQFSASQQTYGLDVADLDNDGDLDVIEANYKKAQRVWLNKGDATFTSSAVGHTSGFNYDVATGDLDNDGDLDAIIAGRSQSELWFNNGDGSFSTSLFGPSIWGNGLDLSDLDNDGGLDAIVSNQLGKQTIWLNNGDGSFETRSFGSGSSIGVEMGDLDNDGDMDAVIVNYFEPQEIWLNKPKVIHSPFAPKVADLSPASNANAVPRNGNIEVTYSREITTSTLTSGNLRVFGSQSGLLSTRGSLSGSPVHTFDPDGKLKPGELVSVSVTGATSIGGTTMTRSVVYSFRAAVDGGAADFTRQSFGSGDSRGIAVGDLDGDGDLDAIVANYDEPQNILLNNGDGTFALSTFGSGPSRAVAIADLDGDGDLDAIVINRNQAKEIWRNNGDASFSSSSYGAGNVSSQGLATGDLDGDGDLDVVITNINRPQELWFNNGDATFRSDTFGTGNSYDVGLGDLDGDGDLDVVVANNSGAAQEIWTNNGDATFTSRLFGNGTSHAIELGDLDGDGDLDAILANSQQQSKIWTNNGDATFSQSNLAFSGPWRDAELGDFDADGDLDLMIANGSSRNALYVNNGNAGFSLKNTAASLASNSSQGLAIGDLDGDGDLDALFANSDEQQTMWLNLPQAPTINSLSAASTTASLSGMRIDVQGTDFEATSAQISTLDQSGAPDGHLALALMSATRAALTVVIPPGYVSTAGTLDLTIGNQSGSTSTTITVLNDQPRIAAQAEIVTIDEDQSTVLSLSLDDLTPGIAALLAIPPVADGTTIASIAQNGATGATTSFLLTPAANAVGSIPLTFGVSDGMLSSSTTLTLTINPINDPPVIATNNTSVAAIEDSQGVLYANLADIDTPLNDITVTASSADQSMIDNAAISIAATAATTRIIFDPVLNTTGRVELVVSADDGEFIRSTTFTINISNVNDAATIQAGDAVVTTDEDQATTSTVLLADIDTPVHQLLLSASSSDQSLLEDSAISFGVTNATTTVFMAPVTNATGSVDLSVTVDDGEFRRSTTFSLTINPVNDPPVIATSNTSVAAIEDSQDVLYVNLADIDTPLNDITMTASSANQSMIDDAAISIGATAATTRISFDPVLNTTGSVELSVFADDGEFIRSTTFTVNIIKVNDAATIQTGDAVVTTNEDQATTATVLLADIDTPIHQLVLRASSGNQSLLEDSAISFGVTNATTTVFMQPATDAAGSAEVTVMVDDGFLTSSTTFTLIVNPVNDPPVLAVIDELTTLDANGLGGNQLVLSDIDTPFNQLSLSATSSDSSLLPVANLSFGATAANVALNIAPACGQSGTALLTISVSDGEFSRATSFNVIVRAIDELTISGSTCGCPDLALAYSALPSLSSASHSWSVEGGRIISGQNSGSIEVVWDSGASSAVVSVLRTTISGCTNATQLAAIPKSIQALMDHSSVSGGSVSIDVLANDIGAGLRISSVSDPADGTALVSSGTIVYTPDAGFSGVELFHYALEDSVGCRATGAIVAATPDLNEANVNIEYVGHYKDRVNGVRGTRRAQSAAISPDGNFVYVAGRNDHSIAIFQRNSVTGELTYKGRSRQGHKRVTGLKYVSDLIVSPDGTRLYAAGYGQNALVIFERNEADGALTFLEAKRRGQADGALTIKGMKRPRAAAISPDGRTIVVSGFADHSLAVFRYSPTDGATNFLEFHKDGLDGVDGLRQALGLAFSLDGRHVYVAGSGDDAIAVFAHDLSSGELTFVERIRDNSGGVEGLDAVSDVAVSPDGQHVYAAGVNDDAIAVFARSASTGTLSFVEALKNASSGISGLKGVRGVAVSPDGAHVWASGSIDNSLVVFKRNLSSGELTFADEVRDGADGVDGLAAAMMAALAPNSAQIYAVGPLDNAVAAFTRNRVPDARDDLAGSVLKNSTLVIKPLLNDSDADNHNLTISAKSNGALGTVLISGGGTTLDYVAGAATGSDQFSYTITDGHGGGSTATVSVAVVLPKQSAGNLPRLRSVPHVYGDSLAVRDLSLQPNPIREAADIEFRSSHAASLRITIRDLQGRELAVVGEREFAAGRHRLRWQARLASGARLAAGSYVVLLEAASDNTRHFQWTLPFVILP